MKVRLFVTLALAAALAAGLAPAAEASTSSRLAKMEKAVKALQKKDAALVATDAGLRSRLTTAEQAIGTLRTQLNATGNLLLNCFQSTSMDLGVAPDWFAYDWASAGPMIVPSLHTGPDGPFFLATITPSCVGAITPVPAASAAATAKAAGGRTMFPTAPLPFPAAKR